MDALFSDQHFNGRWGNISTPIGARSRQGVLTFIRGVSHAAATSIFDQVTWLIIKYAERPEIDERAIASLAPAHRPLITMALRMVVNGAGRSARASSIAQRLATRSLATRTPIVGGNWCAIEHIFLEQFLAFSGVTLLRRVVSRLAGSATRSQPTSSMS